MTCLSTCPVLRRGHVCLTCLTCLSTCPVLRRGHVCMIPNGKHFFISLADHPEWGHSHSVWGEVSALRPCPLCGHAVCAVVPYVQPCPMCAAVPYVKPCPMCLSLPASVPGGRSVPCRDRAHAIPALHLELRQDDSVGPALPHGKRHQHRHQVRHGCEGGGGQTPPTSSPGAPWV